MRYILSLLSILLIIVPDVAFSQRYEIINQNKSANEPSIAVHRLNPSIIVAASNINTIYHSSDTGYTWNEYKLESKHGFYGDPVLHATNDGSIYITHLSRTKGKLWGSWFDRIVVQRSDDGGRSFNEGVGVGYNQDKVQDKPWLASDEYSGKYKGNLYLTWTEFDEYGSANPDHKSRIRFSYSSDRGESWSNAITISDGTGDCRDDDHTLEGATITIDEMGTIYCVWAGHDSIYMDISYDGGLTWGKDKVIGLQPGGWTRSVKGLNRGNGMPFITSDVSTEGNHARLWVVWARDTGGYSRVKVQMSDDHGHTWQSWESALDDQTSPAGDHLFANITADPQSGMVYFLYNEIDRRGDGHFMRTCLGTWFESGEEHSAGSEHMLYVLESTFSLPGEKKFFGDYLDIDVAHGSIHAIYTTTDPSGGLNIVYAQIPIGPTGVKSDAIITDGALHPMLAPGGNLAISFQDSAIHFCLDNLSRARIVIKNRNSLIGRYERSTLKYKNTPEYTYVYGEASVHYDSVSLPYKKTNVKVRYTYFDHQKKEWVKVRRKTKFVRKEDDTDIN